MILRALYELYDRLEADPAYQVPPPGYSYQRISFIVVIELNGSIHEIQDARIQDKNKPRPKQVLVPGGAKKSGSGLNPCFLWDNQMYLLGYAPDRPKRARRAFEAFRKRHLDVEHEIDIPQFSAVCRFLEQWDPDDAEKHPILDEVGTGFGVFQIRGDTRYVHEFPRVREWWEAGLSTSLDAPRSQCIVTGKEAPIARLHPPIKGVVGVQTTGAKIVSFDKSAFKSYNKDQSFNAPVSEKAAFRYVMALNTLIDGPQRDKHRLVVGDTTVVFWTDRPTPTEDIFLRFAAEGASLTDAGEAQDETVRQKLKAFLNALRKGKEAYPELEQSPETTGYFILGLAPNAARIVVRFFHQDTLSNLLDNLRRHFSDIQIERQWTESSKKPDPEFPPIWLLLRQTAREPKNIPPVLAGPLLEAIVTGSKYPAGLYQAVMRRIAADRTINYPRACIIKGYLVRNIGKEVSMSLDRSRNDPAYRLGRLFAVLEKTQTDALGRSINATIRDRFYSSASATPAMVFPRLLRTYQHHLAKLEGGLKVTREKLVQEILDPLEGFPAHLGTAEQGMFALGYYHQMNDFYRSKNDRIEVTEA